jgi:hypothetical protein
MSDDAPAGIRGRGSERFRNRIARSPDQRIVVVDGVADTQHIGRRIGGIAPLASGFE